MRQHGQRPASEFWDSFEPPLEIRAHESIVGKIGMFAIDPVDLLGLPGRKRFLGIEAPGADEETPAAQHLMAARDTAREIVATSKKALLASVTRASSAIRSADSRSLDSRVDALKVLDGAPRPDASVPEQPTLDAHGHVPAVARGIERRC